LPKFIKITDFKEVSPAGIDGHKYRLFFDVGNRTEGSFRKEGAYNLDIEVSGTLQAVWGQNDKELAITSVSSGTSHILDLAGNNQLTDIEPYKLNTYTAPKVPPTIPVSGVGAVFPIVETEHEIPLGGEMSFLSDDISEVRDQINALSNNLWGGRVLLLSQERPLFDMYKPSNTTEEFQTRIQSLGIVVKDLNKEILEKFLGNEAGESTGTIILLENSLAKLSSPGRSSNICSVFKNINYMRQGYPAHGDNAKKVLVAHRFFGLTYPIPSYSDAWEKILGKYFSSMREMRDILSEAWNAGVE